MQESCFSWANLTNNTDKLASMDIEFVDYKVLDIACAGSSWWGCNTAATTFLPRQKRFIEFTFLLFHAFLTAFLFMLFFLLLLCFLLIFSWVLRDFTLFFILIICFFLLLLLLFFLLLLSLLRFEFLTFFEVILDFFIFPLEQTIIELNISHLKLRIIEVDSFKASLFVSKEVINSFQTSFSIHEGDDSHDNQSHRYCDEIENWDDSVHFGGSQTFLSIYGRVHSENDDRGENR